MRTWFLSLLLLLSGCMVGPSYFAPEMELPESFEESPSPIALEEEPIAWWRQFNDPLLEELIEEAIEANYDLAVALEKIEQTRAQFRIEKSHLWPEIDLNATASRTMISKNLFPRTSSAGASPIPHFLNMFQLGFDTIWELDFWGKFRHSKNGAFALFEASNDDYEYMRLSIMSEVAINYISIRAMQAKILLAQEKVSAAEETLSIIKEMHQSGLYNELQIPAQISKLETDRAALPPLETSFKQSVFALAYLIGEPPEGLIQRFCEVAPIPNGNGKIPVGLPSDLLRRRADVRSAERQLASATDQVGAAMADYFPHIALTGISFGAGDKLGSSAGFESYRIDKLLTSPSRMFSVGVGINWDLIDFGRVRARVDVQKSLKRQALLTYEKTVIGSLKDVEGALVAYFNEERRSQSMNAKVTATEKSYQITNDLFNVGLSTRLQTLDALQALIDAKSSFIESQQSLASDLIALYKALGGSFDRCASTQFAEEVSGCR